MIASISFTSGSMEYWEPRSHCTTFRLSSILPFLMIIIIGYHDDHGQGNIKRARSYCANLFCTSLPIQRGLTILKSRQAVAKFHIFLQKRPMPPYLFDCSTRNVIARLSRVFIGPRSLDRSDLWVWLSETKWARFVKPNWCDSGWWRYQLNTNW